MCRNRFCVAAALLSVLTLAAFAQPRPVDWAALGEQAKMSGDPALALEFFSQAYDGGDHSVELLYGIVETSHDVAYQMLDEGEKNGAEQLFVSALETAHRMGEVHPDRAESHLMIALSSGKLAQFKGSKTKVRLGRAVADHSLRAIEIDSTFAPPYAVLGVFYREVATLSWLERLAANALFGGLPDGSLDDSRQFLERSVSMAPGMACLRWELAQTYFAMGREEDAVATLRLSLQLAASTSEDRRTQQQARRVLRDIEHGVRTEKM